MLERIGILHFWFSYLRRTLTLLAGLLFLAQSGCMQIILDAESGLATKPKAQKFSFEDGTLVKDSSFAFSWNLDVETSGFEKKYFVRIFKNGNCSGKPLKELQTNESSFAIEPVEDAATYSVEVTPILRQAHYGVPMCSPYLVGDHTPPTVTVTHPPSDAINSDHLTFSGTCQDATSGISSDGVEVCLKKDGVCEYPQDYSLRASCSEEGSFSFISPSQVEEGSFDLKIRTQDKAGNLSLITTVLGEGTAPFIVDRTAPQHSLSAFVDSFTNATSIQLNGLCSDGPGAGMQEEGIKVCIKQGLCLWPLDYVDSASCDASGNFSFDSATSVHNSNLAEGNYSVQVVAVDRLGNASAPISALPPGEFMMIDRLAPSLAITSTSTLNTNPSVFETNGSCLDDHSGAFGTDIKICVKVGACLYPDDYTYQSTCDSDGNLNIQSTTLGVPTNLPEGLYNVQGYIFDRAGNSSSVFNLLGGSNKLNVDRTPALLVVNYPIDGQKAKEGVSVSGTCESPASQVSIGGSGVANPANVDCVYDPLTMLYKFEHYALFSAGDYGPREVVVTQTDLAGNTRTITRVPEKAPVPRILITSPSDLSRSNTDASVNLSGECEAIYNTVTLEGDFVDAATGAPSPLSFSCPSSGLWSYNVKLLEPDSRLILVTARQNNSGIIGESSKSYERSEAQLLDKSLTGVINTPVMYEINLLAQNPSIWKITFANAANTDALSFVTDNGLWEITDVANLKIKYTPEFAYRGPDQVTLYAYDDRGRLISAILRVDIDNDIQNLKPVLAVRGMACLTCHASVNSSIISDFAISSPWYLGAGTGVPGAGTMAAEGYFANGHGGWQTLNLSGASSRAIVPPNVVAYLNSMTMANNSGWDWRPMIMPASTIRIAAPTQTDITNAGRLNTTTAKYRFFKDNNTVPDISGLTYASGPKYLYNSSDLICYGDLFVKETLYLKNVTIRTNDHGCRIYALKSVFIEGPINYVNTGDNPKRNLQISSAVSINMGIGHAQGTCEDTVAGRYVTHASWPAKNRNNVTESQIITEANKVSTMRDAGCNKATSTHDPALRAVPFERLMLNAPIVQSRYNGNVKGVLIAEVAVFSLGAFSFTYDEAFTSNVLLPLLRLQDLIYVDGYVLF